jgi:hypothetical protein
MATVKKGTLARATQWWKHLRPFGKRALWKRERRAGQRVARAESEHRNPQSNAS